MRLGRVFIRLPCSVKGFEVVILTLDRSVELFLTPKAKEVVPAAVFASSFLILTGEPIYCLELVGL